MRRRLSPLAVLLAVLLIIPSCTDCVQCWSRMKKERRGQHKRERKESNKKDTKESEEIETKQETRIAVSVSVSSILLSGASC